MRLYDNIDAVLIDKGKNEILLNDFIFVFEVEKQTEDIDMLNLGDGTVHIVSQDSDISSSKYSFVMEYDDEKLHLLNDKERYDFVVKRYIQWVPNEDYEKSAENVFSLEGLWGVKSWHHNNIDHMISDYNSIITGDIYKFKLNSDESIGPDGKIFTSVISKFRGDLYLGCRGFDALIRDIKDIIIYLIELSYDKRLPKTQ